MKKSKRNPHTNDSIVVHINANLVHSESGRVVIEIPAQQDIELTDHFDMLSERVYTVMGELAQNDLEAVWQNVLIRHALLTAWDKDEYMPVL